MEIRTFLVVTSLLLSASAFADAGGKISERHIGEKRSSNSIGKISYSLALDFISFDSASTAEKGLGASTTAVQFAGNYSFNRVISASVGVGLFTLEDDNRFSQIVVDNDGFIRLEKSDSRGTSLFAELNVKRPSTQSNSVSYGVGVGATSITKAGRKISNCADCNTIEFDLKGGGYWLATLGARLSNSSGVGLTARHFVSGDLESSVLLWWQSRF